MGTFLWPDWYFQGIHCIPKDFFEKNDIKYLISDIDNTLVTYDDPVPTPRAQRFLEMLSSAGVAVALASNNNQRRVKTFASSAGLPAVHSAAKPLRRGALKAMELIGADIEHCALIGDQLLTDGLTAENLGMRMILVDPVKNDSDANLFFRFKRWIERPIMKRYLKEHPINDPTPWRRRKKQK